MRPPFRMRARRRLERGAATLAVVAILALATATVAVLAMAAAGMAAQARTEAIADLVALAAAHDGRSVAADVAERNGARLVDIGRAGERVRVTVSFGGRVARARAHLEPVGSGADRSPFGAADNE